MATKTTKLSEHESDELVRHQLATAKIHQPFHDFVRSTLNLSQFDYTVVLDEVHTDGWRTIDIRVEQLGDDKYLSTIFLAPGAVNRFPPSLDIPF